MPELNFQVVGASPVEHAASPQLALDLEIACAGNGDTLLPVHSVLLECQVRIEPASREYSDREAANVYELFGKRDLWSRSLRSFLWTQVTVLVPGFIGKTNVNIPVACSYDFNLASAKYFHGLRDGEVPLLVLFSGTVFHQSPSGALQVERIAWSKECRFRLPVPLYEQTIAHYYPNQTPVTLQRDVFDRLQRYKVSQGCTSFDAAIEGLLKTAEGT